MLKRTQTYLFSRIQSASLYCMNSSLQSKEEDVCNYALYHFGFWILAERGTMDNRDHRAMGDLGNLGATEGYMSGQVRRCASVLPARRLRHRRGRCENRRHAGA